MKSTSFTVEITVISGEGLLLDHRRPVKKNAFVKLQADSGNNYQTTKIDKEGGSHPSWKEKFIMEMPIQAHFIKVEVQCNGDKVVGTARVPVSDFVDGYTPPSYLHFLSYRLREENGEPNGIINLSVRVKVPSPEYSVVGSDVPAAVDGNFGGVVMGVPVSCRDYA